MIRSLAAMILALLAAQAMAQHTRALEGGHPPSASIEQLAWLAGSWVGSGMGSPVTETYSAPLGGRISGHFAMADEHGGIAFTELVDYVPQGPSLAYRVRHFNPDMSGWEDRTGKPVVFPLVAVEKDRWFFDGMTLERTGPDAMSIWVRIHDKGVSSEEEFRFTRSQGPASR